MFTGIVTEIGRVEARSGPGVVDLLIDAPRTSRELAVGDSVSVDGVCLTAVAVEDATFRVQVMRETLDRTTLGSRRGGLVNLELAARLSDRLGGHLVQGHVDATAELLEVHDAEGDRRLRLSLSTDLSRYVVPKGSIALNGVALTVSDVDAASFEVALIPHTLEVTTLGRLQVGDQVNVEVDVLSKYVERLLDAPSTGKG